MARPAKTNTEEHVKLNLNIGKDDYVNRNLDKLKALRSWFLWYPDLAFDLMSPSIGGLKLCFDQRVSMRCDARFAAFHDCRPRGSAKTFGNVWVAIVDCIVLPMIEIALSAQTKENAAELLNDKFSEFQRYVPALKNEIAKFRNSKNDCEIDFRNQSRLDTLSNSQNSKGQRRKRLRMEESALVDEDLFQDALKPVVEVARSTCGKLAITDPCELNQQICYYTTPGWRGSDEHNRVLKMIRNMVDLKGEMVIGCDWMLPCWYGRGSTKAQILEKMKTMNPTAFKQNYGGEWTGSSTGALVNINSLLKCRTLTEPVFKPDKNDEIFIGVDVARSQNSANNQSSMAIARVRRNEKNNRVQSIEIINLFNIANTLNFTNQAIIVKNMQKQYNAKAVVLDSNGLGIGLVDELLKNTYDPRTGDFLPCFGSLNTTNQSEDPQNEIRCLYEMKAQTAQTKIIGNFIDVVDSGTLRLLEQKQYDVFAAERDEEYQGKFMPYIQTDLLVEEVANLKLETNGKNLSVKKEVGRIDKDRFSALAYVIYYILEYENNVVTTNAVDFEDIFMFRAPQIRM